MSYNPNKLIIFSAPSGAGKTTIVRELMRLLPNLSFSISATTREAREKEVDGKDYYFLSVSDFEQKINENAFIEWEEVYQNQYYGTLKNEIERNAKLGKSVIFDVDVVGGLNIKKQYKDRALAIFVQAPSLSSLEQRLRLRSTESEEKIATRLAKASKELAYANQFDYILKNDDLNKAIAEAHVLVKKFISQGDL